MKTVTYEHRVCEIEEDETVLDCLHRHGYEIPYGCKVGACHSCAMVAAEGQVPEFAQEGLREVKRAAGHFLSCRCVPEESLTVTLPGEPARTHTSRVLAADLLNHEVLRLRLEQPECLGYRAGQFIQIHGENGLARSYSLASVPGEEPWLELHIRKVPFGRLSNWAHDALTEGVAVTVSSAMGECFYLAGRPDQPMLLIGTGSGLAPLWGIARDALAHGHTGPIHLYHGSSHFDGLYLMDELRALADAHSNVFYTPALSREHRPGIVQGRAHDLAMRAIGALKGWRVFLCGNPDMVRAARLASFMAGVASDDLYSDPFVFAPHPSGEAA